MSISLVYMEYPLTNIPHGLTISNGTNPNAHGGIVTGGNANAILKNLVIKDNSGIRDSGLYSFSGDITLILKRRERG